MFKAPWTCADCLIAEQCDYVVRHVCRYEGVAWR